MSVVNSDRASSRLNSCVTISAMVAQSLRSASKSGGMLAGRRPESGAKVQRHRSAIFLSNALRLKKVCGLTQGEGMSEHCLNAVKPPCCDVLAKAIVDHGQKRGVIGFEGSNHGVAEGSRPMKGFSACIGGECEGKVLNALIPFGQRNVG